MEDPRIDGTPDTVNEILYQSQIRHHVQILRLERSIARRVSNLLRDLDRDLEEQLARRIGALSGNDRIALRDRSSFTTVRLQALRTTVANQRRESERLLRESVASELREVADFEAESQVNLLRNALAGLSLDIVTPEASLLRSLVRSRPLQGRLLRERTSAWSQDKRARVNQAIRLGIAAGEGIPAISRRIRAEHATKRIHADSLARTATVSVASHAALETARANPTIIRSVLWTSVLDHRACPVCFELDGQTFPIESGPRPPAHINCRCAITYVTPSFRELGLDIDEVPEGLRASVNGQVPQSLTAEQWLRREPRAAVIETLGPTRARLFLDGNLPIGRFVDRRGNNFTVDQIRQREAALFERLGL